MTEVVFWAAVVAFAFVVGACVALSLRISARLLALLLVHCAELLATAITLSVMAEAEYEVEHGDEGLVGALVIASGLVLGAAVVFVAGVAPADDWPHRRDDKLYLLRLGVRELSLIGAGFVAIGAGLAEVGYVDVLLVLAMLITNYLRAIQGTAHLRKLGVSAPFVFMYWILMGICLVGFAMLGFLLFKQTGSGGHAFIFAAAGGAMMASLPELEPAVAMGRGSFGFIAALRFGLAFLLVSLLTF